MSGVGCVALRSLGEVEMIPLEGYPAAAAAACLALLAALMKQAMKVSRQCLAQHLVGQEAATADAYQYLHHQCLHRCLQVEPQLQTLLTSVVMATVALQPSCLTPPGSQT